MKSDSIWPGIFIRRTELILQIFWIKNSYMLAVTFYLQLFDINDVRI
jgi:hypothetical protein